jgi:hypothetical protein
MRGLFENIPLRDVAVRYTDSSSRLSGSSSIPLFAKMNKFRNLEIDGCKFVTGQHPNLHELDWDTWIAEAKAEALMIRYPREHWLGEDSFLDVLPTICPSAERVWLRSLIDDSDDDFTVAEIACFPLYTFVPYCITLTICAGKNLKEDSPPKSATTGGSCVLCGKAGGTCFKTGELVNQRMQGAETCSWIKIGIY